MTSLSRGTWVPAVFLPIAVLFVIGAVIPVPLYTNLGGEYWWKVVIHDAFLRGSSFGTDVVFTYGPWGFLLDGFHPGTAGLMFLLRAAIASVCTIAVWKLGAESGRKRIAAAVIAVSIVVVHVCWADAFFLFVPFLILLAGFQNEEAKRPAIYWILIAIGALISLAKFSLFVMVFGVIGVVTLDELRRRRLPATLAAHCSALVALWLAARQPLAGVVPYLRNSVEMASGYGEAMGDWYEMYARPAWTPFLLSMVLFAAIVAFAELQRSLREGVLFSLGLLFLLFLLFKSAFVRADHFHIAPASGALLLAQLTWLMTRNGRKWGVISVSLLAPVALAAYAVQIFGEGSYVRDVPASIRASARTLVRVARWPAFKGEMLETHQRALTESPAPVVPARGDIYPVVSGTVFQQNLTYDHRPVFMSYAAYTPALADLNTRWLARRAPSTVMFDIDPIDDQYPSLQDGPSWPILLTRYDATGRLGRHVMLTRKPEPSRVLLVPLSTVAARLGERVNVPEQPARAFVRLTIDLNTAGRMANVLYKPPLLHIRVGLQNGSEKQFRLVRGMAQAGFLLSPLVEDADAFAALVNEEEGAGAQVRWLQVDSDAGAHFTAYEPAYRIEFLALR
ncbi:MAG TPA: hypothetical protein VF701_06845 [Thermoanaerobaculia bacterium]